MSLDPIDPVDQKTVAVDTTLNGVLEAEGAVNARVLSKTPMGANAWMYTVIAESWAAPKPEFTDEKGMRRYRAALTANGADGVVTITPLAIRR